MPIPPYSNLIDLIQNGKTDTALNLMVQRLSKDCFGLIRSRNRSLSRYEVLNVFYHAFLGFCDRVNTGRFQYKDDSAFVTYFKSACVNQVRNDNRVFCSRDMILSADILEILETKTSETRKEVSQDFIRQKLDLYDIRLDLPEIEDEHADRLKDVVRVFHTLGKKCRLLILFRFFIKLSHLEISENYGGYLEIKTPEVSRVLLGRCIGQIRKALAA